MQHNGEECVLAAATTSGCFVDFFSTRTGRHLGRVDGLVRTPHEMTVEPERGLLYIAHTYRAGGYGSSDWAHEISIVDPRQQRVVDVIDTAPYVGPHDIEFSRHDCLLYASVERNPAGRQGIIVLDPRKRAVIGLIPTAGANAHWMSLTSDGRCAFVAHKEEEFVSVVDLRSRTLVDTIPTPGGTEEIDSSPDGRWAYVVTPFSGMVAASDRPHAAGVSRPVSSDPVLKDPAARVLKIDTSTRKVVSATDLDPHLTGLRVMPSGDILVAQQLHPVRADRERTKPGTVTLIDATSMRPSASATTGRMPLTMRAHPDGSVAYVANVAAGTVSVLELPTLALLDTWRNDHGGQTVGGIHGMALLPL